MTFFPDETANLVICGPGETEGRPERAWHISDMRLRRSEGVAHAAGWGDMRESRATHQWFTTARGDGARWLGAVVDPHTFELPLAVHAGDRPMAVVEDSFWSDVDYDFQSRLYVNTKFAGTRWVDFRQSEPAQPLDPDLFEFDRELEDHLAYLLPVVAENPYWQGFEVAVEWRPGQKPQDITNPGDRPAYIEWTLSGPGVFRLPDGDRVVTTPLIMPGEVARVLTSPSHRTAKSNRRPNLIRDFGGQRFRSAVPPRRSMSLAGLTAIGAASSTSAVAMIRPKYRRPW